jgi:hypothetical protein
MSPFFPPSRRAAVCEFEQPSANPERSTANTIQAIAGEPVPFLNSAFSRSVAVRPTSSASLERGKLTRKSSSDLPK